MAILGLLFLAAVGVVGTGLLVGGRDYSSDAHIFGQTIGGVGESGLIATGMVLGLLAAFGMALITRGMLNARKVRRVNKVRSERVSQERDELARRVSLEAETAYDLRVQRDNLAEQLDGSKPLPAQAAKN